MLFFFSAKLIPSHYKTTKTKPKKNILIIRKIVNTNLGLDKAEGEGMYLKKSDDLKSTDLKELSYKKIKKQLDQYDRIESHPDAKPLELTDLDIKDFDPEVVKKTLNLRPVKLKGREIEKFLKDNKVRRVRYQEFTPTLNNSQVSIQMEIPKGFKVEKIDQLSNVFYSFQRRISLAYVNSFFNKLTQFELQNPQLDFPMTRQSLTMTAKVTFDNQGNLQTVKMMKWTDKDKLQDFFTNVLDGIQSIPNPPKAIIKNKETFNIYYTLKLN
jgi:hypothetical protein